jgi:hypothetical protein
MLVNITLYCKKKMIAIIGSAVIDSEFGREDHGSIPAITIQTDPQTRVNW